MVKTCMQYPLDYQRFGSNMKNTGFKISEKYVVQALMQEHRVAVWRDDEKQLNIGKTLKRTPC